MFASKFYILVVSFVYMFCINPVCHLMCVPCLARKILQLILRHIEIHSSLEFLEGGLATVYRDRCIQSAALFIAARELNCTVSEILVNSQTAVCCMHANGSGAERRAALLIHYIGQFLSSAHSVSTLPSPPLTSQFFLRE